MMMGDTTVQSDGIFEKYCEQGAYHWNLTYSRSFRRSSPRMHAIYDVPLDIVSRKLGFGLDRLVGADVGCGDGVLLYKAARRRGRVIGIDATMSGLRLAAVENGRREFQPCLLNGLCHQLPLPSSKLDFVIAIEVIEHLEDDRAFVRDVARILRPGGVFVCTTPHRLPDDPPVRDRYHVREYMGEDLKQILQEHFSVELLGLFPVWLDQIYLYDRPKLVGQAIRFFFKLLARVYNPYRRVIVYNVVDNTRCANLMAVGIKRTVSSPHSE